MTILPQQANLLIRMKDMKSPKGGLVLSEHSEPLCPYGEVISVGPECRFTSVGANVLFLPANLIAGFDEHSDPKFILPESAVFAKIVLEETN